MKKSSSDKPKRGLTKLLGYGSKFLFVLFLGLTNVPDVKAQAIDSYRYLAQSKIQKGFDVDFQWVQAKNDSALLTVFLSIPHQQLSFERQADSSYAARYQLNVEIYKGFYEDENSRELAERIFIGDTVIVNQYDQTLDPNEFTQVLTTLSLPLDEYTIHMDYTYLKGWPAITGIQIDSKKLERLNPNRRRTRNSDSKSTTFKQYIPKEILREIGLQLYPPKTQLPLYLFNASEDSTTNANIAFLTKDKTTIATWIGSTNRVIFSEKSYLGIPIFALDSLSSFDLVISTKSTPRSVLGTKTIQRSELPFFEVSLPLSNQLLESTSIFHTQFYLVELETEILENKGYNLELKSNDQVIYSLNFETYWQDMPTSLLQLDVAIEMLRYIMSEKMIEDVLKKNQEEKLTWFNSFWESKDPIPTTAKNELMSEYYRRIDYAFDQYSTTSKPEGYDSDQGQIYIKIGPPREIVRSFPTNGRVIEEWIYPNRTFVFTASSGFGDFTLINANQEN